MNGVVDGVEVLCLGELGDAELAPAAGCESPADVVQYVVKTTHSFPIYQCSFICSKSCDDMGALVSSL